MRQPVSSCSSRPPGTTASATRSRPAMRSQCRRTPGPSDWCTPAPAGDERGPSAMVDTVDDAPSGPVAAGGNRMTAGDRVRFVLRGIGQTLITAGVVVLLFVIYEVYVTNYFAHEAQQRTRTALQKTWVNGKADPLLPLPGQSLPPLPEGKGIAILYIPRLGNDYSFAIVEGTSDKDLTKGPGHYTGTALPGQVGNFAVAGHRVGNGEPFLNLDHLRAGDAIIVRT